MIGDYVFMWIPLALGLPLLALVGACMVWLWEKVTGHQDTMSDSEREMRDRAKERDKRVTLLRKLEKLGDPNARTEIRQLECFSLMAAGAWTQADEDERLRRAKQQPGEHTTRGRVRADRG